MKIVKAFDQPFGWSLDNLGLCVSYAPVIQRIDRERGLETEAARIEMNARATDVAVAVAAEDRDFRRQMLVNAYAPADSVLTGAVIQPAPYPIVTFAEAEWDRDVF